MLRILSGFVLVLVLPLFGQSGLAGPPVPKKWSVNLALTVSPQAAPVPALRYRLFPLWSERKPGDAAPIYLRFAHERGDSMRKELAEKPAQWNELPLAQLPLREARAFVDRWDYNLKQLDLGARRKSCDWNYTLDVDNVIAVRLPDAQEMRLHGGLLGLKARVEIADGNYADALRTLETGFAFSNHVGEGAFILNGLIGMAIANRLTDCLPELVQRPDAPNLYWALTAVPRPLVDPRKGMDVEQRMGEMLYRDLTDLERERSADEWSVALRRVVTKLRQIRDDLGMAGGKSKIVEMYTLVQALPAAKKHLIEVMGVPEKKVAAMPAAQVLLLHLAAEYREARDDAFRAIYLPYPQARKVAAEARKRWQDKKRTWEGVYILDALVPTIEQVLLAQVKLERKFAALRVVEALRMHAAANKGHLPDKLDEIKLAPIPLDPCTGQPFDYQHDGDTATITSVIAGDQPTLSGLRIQVTLRK